MSNTRGRLSLLALCWNSCQQRERWLTSIVRYTTYVVLWRPCAKTGIRYDLILSCSNGAMDPWHGGGVLQSLSDTLVAIVINSGAHHLDLRAPNPADPEEVTQARQIEMRNIHRWIASYHHTWLCRLVSKTPKFLFRALKLYDTHLRL